jgi:hypothetical protein
MSAITLSADQLDWYNRGIVLLMSVMRGRADHGQAERQVYDDWRQEGELLDTPGIAQRENS